MKHGHVIPIMNDTQYATLVTGTTWENPDEPGASPTIDKNATVTHCQQANKTYGEPHRITKNAFTMEEAYNHQIIETIENKYIVELHNKYTRNMVSKAINMFHHLIDRYGKFLETDLKENQTKIC